MSKERYENLYRLHTLEGELAYSLTIFGDKLAKREGYRSGLDGMEAIHFYLVHKFGWPPAKVRAMSSEDIRFILQEEMHGFTLPKAAVFR
ncbi:hypothetical protein QVM54_27395 [Pseudomonas aeruginosa]|jgi:hypothetical protein|uniref:hypothetical protein n=1 Tax=Pseudomonas aeruginosa TaxID=287 RepID=UPI000513A09F|nr:hypothetical protein [Pseudomonas aeruginosa]MBQ9381767.1 hypothetical protein [Pseudomonas sp.]ATH02743.1 hypothetical protein AXX03_10935 [Pseudomonas aeruginosa]KAA5581190.1 hypothetical protein F3G48_04250 [Pseudomonas aeruginosa]KHE56111.1 hypothetical protein D407_0226830 [Pseudomonas aeruginosa]KXE65076.1 hypothetical protein AW929_14475 [Pseudomonas aeruginosa]